MRVGRAVRTFERISSLKVVVGVMFRALAQLLRISFLFVILAIIFACVGVQLCVARHALLPECIVVFVSAHMLADCCGLSLTAGVGTLQHMCCFL